MIDAVTTNAMMKTKVENERVHNYQNPQKITTHLNEKYRNEKFDQAQMRGTFQQQVKHELPRASKERIDAVVFARMYAEMNLAKEPEDPELTLKPDMSKTLRSHKEKHYYHNGTWGKTPFSKKESWSCCMDKDKDSQGCVAVVKDKKKWILSSCA